LRAIPWCRAPTTTLGTYAMEIPVRERNALFSCSALLLLFWSLPRAVHHCYEIVFRVEVTRAGASIVFYPISTSSATRTARFLRAQFFFQPSRTVLRTLSFLCSFGLTFVFPLITILPRSRAAQCHPPRSRPLHIHAPHPPQIHLTPSSACVSYALRANWRRLWAPLPIF
jgi:hypothetical protein